MTAAHHIAQAERALRTSPPQPNLAILHMRRAREESWLDVMLMRLVQGVATSLAVTK